MFAKYPQILLSPLKLNCNGNIFQKNGGKWRIYYTAQYYYRLQSTCIGDRQPPTLKLVYQSLIRPSYYQTFSPAPTGAKYQQEADGNSNSVILRSFHRCIRGTYNLHIQYDRWVLSKSFQQRPGVDKTYRVSTHIIRQ